MTDSRSILRIQQAFRIKYNRIWLALLAGCAVFFFWEHVGEPHVRRFLLAQGDPPAYARTSPDFLALLFPRISSARREFTITDGDFERILAGLRAQGCHSIGIKDIQEYYVGGRKFPERAVFLALDRDNPESVEMADKALKKFRMRATVFQNRTSARNLSELRHALSAHAVKRLKRSGAWDFGWTSEISPAQAVHERGPLLDGDGRHFWTDDPLKYPFRFVVDKTGYNDERGKLSALRILRVRSEKPVEDTLRMIAGSWPRRDEFVDDFRLDALGLDWVPAWGVISAAHHRMALIPTPRQTGAAVFLSGTERWRDEVLEFELRKYKQAFWAYIRDRNGNSFVRMGAMNGFWSVQQKISARKPVSTLARMPLPAGGLPARVQAVMKGEWLLVLINGRIQFGKALHVDPSIDRGRTQFGVYSPNTKSALGFLTFVRAKPLPPSWVAIRDSGLSDESLNQLREQALYAAAISPRWLYVRSDGGVSLVPNQGELIRSLAGFYHCRFLPMLDLAASGLGPVLKPGNSTRFVQDLVSAVDTLDAAGLNLRLSAPDSDRGQVIRFLQELRGNLHGRHRELWLTLSGPGVPDPAWATRADGILTSLRETPTGWDLIEAQNLKTPASSGQTENP